MSEINAKLIKKSIKAILVGADLSQLTSKKVRKQLEKQFDADLTDRKKEIDEILMNEIEEANAAKSENNEKDISSVEEESDESDSNDSESSFEEKRKVKQKSKPVSRKRSVSPDTISKSKSKKSKTTKSSDDVDKPRKKTGFSKDMSLSDDLATLFGTDMLPRCDVVKKMYGIFRERDLLDQYEDKKDISADRLVHYSDIDPSNKQYVICDEQLHKIFGVKRFRAFGMMKYLKRHIKDPKDQI